MLKKIFALFNKNSNRSNKIEHHKPAIVKATNIEECKEFIGKMLTHSLMDVVRVEAVEQIDLPITASKLLGVPYFPTTQDYPCDGKNRPMMLLAQINFSEVPDLEGFPKKGILQFFISPYDNMDSIYGMNYNNKQDQTDFRVLYHAIVEETWEQVELPFFNIWSNDIRVPITKEHQLHFSLSQELAPFTDWRHRAYFGDIYPEEYDTVFFDAYNDLTNAIGHKIGGYAYFTQNYDPRIESEAYKDYILLLQIDSIGSSSILWGDGGVANWFIHKQDLINLDFSRVLYTWDCA